MAWVTPPTETAGAVLAAADLNVIRDDLTYLKAQTDLAVFSGFGVDRNGATQSIPNATWTLITFTREGYDAGGWIAVSSDTATLPAGAIPAGYTTVIVDARMVVTFAANAVGIRKAQIVRTGATFVTNAYSAASADTTDLIGSALTTAVSGDTFQLQVYQSSGGALNIATAAMSVCVFKPLS